MAQKKSNPPRRQWRKDRSAALANAAMQYDRDNPKPKN